jgi:DNA-directed RNA polymerase specialized sigma subunit
MWKHSHVPMEELIAIANEQLVIAAKKWKPTNGSSFATFAKQIIIRGTRRALDNTSLGIRLPVNVAEKIKKYHYTVRSLSQILGRKPTNLEICTIMGTTEDKLAMLQTYLNREPVSLDAINEERMEEENHD